MNSPSTGFIVIRGGIVEESPDHMPVFDMDILEDGMPIVDDEADEVLDLRARIVAAIDGSTAGDGAYLQKLVAECDAWLGTHAPGTKCGNCGEPIKADDNGAGRSIWVHNFGSTVCHDDPPGSMDGDVLHAATPAN